MLTNRGMDMNELGGILMMELFSSYTLSPFLQGTSAPFFNIKISWIHLMLLEISKEILSLKRGGKREWEGMLWNSVL